MTWSQWLRMGRAYGPGLPHRFSDRVRERVVRLVYRFIKTFSSPVPKH